MSGECDRCGEHSADCQCNIEPIMSYEGFCRPDSVESVRNILARPLRLCLISFSQEAVYETLCKITEDLRAKIKRQHLK